MAKPKKESAMQTRITVDMPQDLHRRLKIMAVNAGKSMRELILEWVKSNVERAEKK